MSLKPPDKLRRLQGALYGKAKREPGYRFYCLYDKVVREDVLRHAYALCKQNRGAPGVDGETFEDIEAYGVERWLQELREELRAGRYKPQAVRRVKIPKPGGGQRPLGIPRIRDRVAQTAAKLVLEPIFEADFDEAAYGYRPGRSALQAVQRVHEAVQRGHVAIVDADLSQYFDTIPHAELMKCLPRRLSDRKLLRLLKTWLKVPVEERGERGRVRRTGGKRSTRGTPQGGPLSPYIKAFRRARLEEQHGAVLVTYADDLVVLCRRNAGQVLEATRQWMTTMRLSLNETKTHIRNARHESFDFLGYTFGPMISSRTGTRYLGAKPSKKALRRVKERVKTVLRTSHPDPWDEVRDRLNRLLRGWAQYFVYGTTHRTRRIVDLYVYDRVRHFLRRRHKVRSRGTARFPEQRVFGELGVLSIQTLPKWQWKPTHAVS